MKKYIFSLAALFLMMTIIVACRNNTTSNESSGEQSVENEYAEILKYADKMNTEADSFYKVNLQNGVFLNPSNGEHYEPSQKLVYSFAAMSEALNNALQIRGYVDRIKEGGDVVENLQHIDGECFQVEQYCNDAISELDENSDIIITSFKNEWVDVLNRFKGYSETIREHVQTIRNSQ